ncbi:MAG TPA: hypothetical protein VIU40_09245, partial [Geobacteraceae bacterium]
VMREFGLKPMGRDVSVERGLECVSKGLNTLIKGRARSMYDRVGCQLLIEGYEGGYIFRPPSPQGTEKEEPLKDGYYEHMADADRYLEVMLSYGTAFRIEDYKPVLRRPTGSITGR